jgi:hypothetical protein
MNHHVKKFEELGSFDKKEISTEISSIMNQIDNLIKMCGNSTTKSYLEVAKQNLYMAKIFQK